MANKKNEETKTEIALSNKIVLRSVRGKVGIVVKIQPSIDPKTRRFPDCVKRVNSVGDMILSDAERNDPNSQYFIKETDVFDIVDGTTFDLDDTRDRFIWEAIKNCPLIAQDYFAKDSKGNSLIHGTMDLNNPEPRYGLAELYVYRPGVEAQKKVSKKKLLFDAQKYIWEDERGYDGRALKAKVLGHRMDNQPDADITDYLLQVAEKDPQKIINLYTEGDTGVRLLFVEARDKHVINYKDRLYMYQDNIILGATDEAAIAYLKDPKNKNVYNLIKKDTYPDLMEGN
jgi:hypothetical protein